MYLIFFFILTNFVLPIRNQLGVGLKVLFIVDLVMVSWLVSVV